MEIARIAARKIYLGFVAKFHVVVPEVGLSLLIEPEGKAASYLAFSLEQVPTVLDVWLKLPE